MSTDSHKVAHARELTVRGVLLGIAITLVFTAANVYLGLKVALTIASSIPAAVISMAVLSVFPGSNIRENNIVQTVASAAGALSAIIFVLPGLVIVGWWSGFPFWLSFFVCASGGTLGVLFTIPLRRALVTTSDLPYPEGVAAAEVLKVGSDLHDAGVDAQQAREGLLAISLGTLASAGFALLTATRIAADEVQGFFALGAASASGYDIAFSLALLGAGHLVGLSVGIAMLAGLLIAWVGLVPVLTALYPEPGATLEAHVSHIWTADVRLVGAGAMGVAALWTLGKLAHPLVTGFVRAIAASRQAQTAGDHTDQDMSPASILAISLICLIVIAVLVENFIASGPLAGSATALTIAALPFVVIAGFIVAAICGYMAGLTGSSNSPVSGVGILAIVASAAIFAVIVHPTPATGPALIALALFVTAIVFGVAIVSNDNLQDLKTGQLVGASPKLQQIALIIGVIAGAAVIPPVLNLLAHAYGFAGAPHNEALAAKPLAAPQANLISALALGVIGGTLNWTMIGIGIGLGAVIAVIDSVLGAKKLMRLPPLAVGMGLYLPMSLTVALLIGALIGAWYNRQTMKSSDPVRSQHLGVLVASGMIVGESLFEILRAGLIVGFSTGAPLGIAPEDFSPAPAIGSVSYAVIIVLLYGWLMRRLKPQGTHP